MFQVEREWSSQKVAWSHRTPDAQNYLYFIECWQEEDLQSGSSMKYHSQQGWLLESEIDQWLKRETLTTSTSSSTLPFQLQQPESGFRVLVVEQPMQTPSFPISEQTFCNIEKTLSLSPLTLPSLMNFTGVHFKQYNTRMGSKDVDGMNLIVKSASKIEISNALLSINHNFARKWTNALLCGRGLLRSQDVALEYGQHHEHILALIKASSSLWTHPLFLPTIILRDCCKRIQISSTRLSDSLTDLERDIGITHAGRARPNRPLDNWPADIDFKSVTIGLHSTGAQIVFVSHVSSWACSCLSFLLKLGSELGDKFPNTVLEFEPLKEQLDYELCTMTNYDRFLHGYKERLQAQINVLLSAISQRDSAIAIDYARLAQEQTDISRRQNQLTIKIAVLSKRDSVAMMAFTFITALFLPGTAIATLFSMPMFDWGDTSDLSSNRVSVTSNFWIYWAATGPLTLAVMIGWYIWYLYKNRRWEKETDLQLKKIL